MINIKYTINTNGVLEILKIERHKNPGIGSNGFQKKVDPLHLFSAARLSILGLPSLPGLQRVLKNFCEWENNLSLVQNSVRLLTEGIPEEQKVLVSAFLEGTDGKRVIDENFTVHEPGSLIYKYYRAKRLCECLYLEIPVLHAIVLIKENEETPGKFRLAIQPYKWIQDLRFDIGMRTHERDEARNHPFKNLWEWLKMKIGKRI